MDGLSKRKVKVLILPKHLYITRIFFELSKGYQCLSFFIKQFKIGYDIRSFTDDTNMSRVT